MKALFYWAIATGILLTGCGSMKDAENALPNTNELSILQAPTGTNTSPVIVSSTTCSAPIQMQGSPYVGLYLNCDETEQVTYSFSTLSNGNITGTTCTVTGPSGSRATCSDNTQNVVAVFAPCTTHIHAYSYYQPMNYQTYNFQSGECVTQ